MTNSLFNISQRTLLLFVSLYFFLNNSSIAQTEFCIDQSIFNNIDSTSQNGVFLKSYKWETGSTLRVRFLGGEEYIQSQIKQIVKEWEEYANIHFDFVSSGSSDIRIAFRQGYGSHSVIGTRALDVPQNLETMNFGWFNLNTPYEEIRRTTLHEFGHALGLLHEHQNPETPIEWNSPKIYAYFFQTQGWTKEEVDHNILNRYKVGQTNYVEFDPYSIMIYPIPAEFTLNNYSVGLNTELSQKDKKLIGELYPYTLKERLPIEINVPHTKAGIKNISIDYGAYSDEQKGILIDADFWIDNYKGQNGKYCVSILDQQDSSMLCVKKNFTPRFEESDFDDNSVFIGLDELNLPNGKHNLAIVITVIDADNNELSNSGKYTFTYYIGPRCLDIEYMSLKIYAESKDIDFVPEFHLRNAKQFECKMVVEIFDQSGEKIMAQPNSPFSNQIGQLCSWVKIKPCCATRDYNDAGYEDEYISIPYDEFHLSEGANHFNAKFSIQDLNGSVLLDCYGSMIPFTINN